MNISRISLPGLWSAGVILYTVVGGFSAVMIAFFHSGTVLHDLYYVLAYFHHVLTVSVVFVFFALWYHFFPKITGLRFHTLTGHLHLGWFFIGTVMALVSRQMIGMMGMPRRIHDYGEHYSYWNDKSETGILIIEFSFAVFVVGVIIAFIEQKKVCAE